MDFTTGTVLPPAVQILNGFFHFLVEFTGKHWLKLRFLIEKLRPYPFISFANSNEQVTGTFPKLLNFFLKNLLKIVTRCINTSSKSRFYDQPNPQTFLTVAIDILPRNCDFFFRQKEPLVTYFSKGKPEVCAFKHTMNIYKFQWITHMWAAANDVSLQCRLNKIGIIVQILQ